MLKQDPPIPRSDKTGFSPIEAQAQTADGLKDTSIGQIRWNSESSSHPKLWAIVFITRSLDMSPVEDVSQIEQPAAEAPQEAG